jgi:hypothetical protein
MKVQINIREKSKIRNWERINQNLINEILGIVYSNQDFEFVLDLTSTDTKSKKDLINFAFKTLFKISTIIKDDLTDRLSFKINGSVEDLNISKLLFREEIKNYKPKNLNRVFNVDKILNGVSPSKQTQKDIIKNNLEMLMAQISKL